MSSDVVVTGLVFSPEMAYMAFKRYMGEQSITPYDTLPDHEKGAWAVITKSYVEQIKGQIPFILRPYVKEIGELKRGRSQAYWERNNVIAALSKFMPSHLTKHREDDPNWDKEWLNIICIHGPRGQMTWHIHDAEMYLFNHLDPYTIPCDGWDGHKMEEKYGRLAQISLGQVI